MTPLDPLREPRGNMSKVATSDTGVGVSNTNDETKKKYATYRFIVVQANIFIPGTYSDLLHYKVG